MPTFPFTNNADNATIDSTNDADGANLDAQGGADTVTITTGADIADFLAGSGQDNITLNGGAVTGNLDLGIASDILLINSGSIGGNVLGNGGSDTISITGGSITGTVDGGAGSDTIMISGGTIGGNVRGGINVDTITVSGGTITGDVDLGDGNDNFIMTGGLISGDLRGDTGADEITLDGGTLSGDLISGIGDDTINITNATVGGLIDARDGDDIVNGGVNADNIDGGIGNDTIDGGGGNDTITGGQGTDTVTGGEGFDTFILKGTASNILTITDFNTGTGQDINNGDTTDNDFVDLSPYFTTIEELRADYDDDGIINQSIGDFSDNLTLEVFINFDGLGASSELTADNTGIVCFASGSYILTATGEKPVETLKVGDRVVTKDNGLQTIRWVGSCKLDVVDLAANPNMRPIRIQAGALGAGLPERDLVVSPQHRMLTSSKIARRMFGDTEVLVAAKQLLCLNGVDIAHDLDEVTYVHFLCAQHEVVFAEGAPSESLYTGKMALQSVGEEARQEIFTLFPELLEMDADSLPTPARPLIPGRKARQLADRHRRNGRLLMEPMG